MATRSWCHNNNLQHDISKSKKLIVDYRKQHDSKQILFPKRPHPSSNCFMGGHNPQVPFARRPYPQLLVPYPNLLLQFTRMPHPHNKLWVVTPK